VDETDQSGGNAIDDATPAQEGDQGDQPIFCQTDASSYDQKITEEVEEEEKEMERQYIQETVGDIDPLKKRYNTRGRRTDYVGLSKGEQTALFSKLNKDEQRRLIKLVGVQPEHIALHISVKEGLRSDRKQEVIEAMCEEIKNMIDYEVGHFVHRSDIPYQERKNIVHSFMFIKHKMTPNGEYERTKARLVANGAHQSDTTYDLIASATVALSAVFLLLNIACYLAAMMSVIDVKGAFLHAMVEKVHPNIYVIIAKEVAMIWTQIDPSVEKYLEPDGTLIMKLKKFIYGLKQSPLMWQMDLTKTLASLGYKQSDQDKCIFVKHVGTNFAIISTHVDDLLQVYTDKRFYEELCSGLIARYGQITAQETASSYLGMSLSRSDDQRTLDVKQTGLARECIDTFEKVFGEAKSARTPATVDLFEQTRVEDGWSLHKIMKRGEPSDAVTETAGVQASDNIGQKRKRTPSTCAKRSTAVQSEDRTLYVSASRMSRIAGGRRPDRAVTHIPEAGTNYYHSNGNKEENRRSMTVDEAQRRAFLSVVMKAMYLARLTRPDLLLATSYLASRSHVVTETDVKHLRRLMGYLKRTIETGITLSCDSLNIVAGCDASYGIHSDGKGHTGFCVGLGSNQSYVYCRSGKQTVGSTSSTDSEVIALAEATKYCVWLRNLLTSLRITSLSSITIYQDNQSCITMHQEEGNAKRSRHLLTKIGYVKDQIVSKVVKVKWRPGCDLPADVLTKPLQGSSYVQHTEVILGGNIR